MADEKKSLLNVDDIRPDIYSDIIGMLVSIENGMPFTDDQSQVLSEILVKIYTDGEFKIHKKPGRPFHSGTKDIDLIVWAVIKDIESGSKVKDAIHSNAKKYCMSYGNLEQYYYKRRKIIINDAESYPDFRQDLDIGKKLFLEKKGELLGTFK